jgi:PAS domain S-box-containing protein
MLAVLIVSIGAGFVGGLVTAALAIALVAYQVPDGQPAIGLTMTHVWQFTAFGIVATLISALATRRRNAELTLAATIGSIGDGVIVADTRGIVTFINHVAQTLTGWRAADAIGKPVARVFNIITEETRAAVDHPVDRVLRERSVVALSDHTLLVARDGTERPIADSGAPIAGPGDTIVGAVLVFRDMSREREEERVRRAAEERHKMQARVLESMAEGVILADEKGYILYTNAAQDAMFRYGHGEFVGQHVMVQNAMTPEAQKRRTAEILSDLESNGSWVGEFDNVRKDGSGFTSRARISRLDHGGRRYIVCVQEDITTLKRIEREREDLLLRERAARGDAERANQLKDEFLATLSHELRTPLNSVLGWTRMLVDHDLPPLQRSQALATIHRNSLAQARLIDEILDLSQVITGRMSLSADEVDLSVVVRTAADSFTPAILAKRQHLHLQLGSGAVVTGDADRLGQVVWNLLSNATKFTPEQGNIVVTVEYVDREVRLTVSDNGCGIDPDFLPFAFDRFRQGDSSSTRAHGGLGLGLALVRHLVESHGGSVRASSPGLNLGTTVEVVLPARVAVAAELR